jgi:hypothetical protein
MPSSASRSAIVVFMRSSVGLLLLALLATLVALPLLWLGTVDVVASSVPVLRQGTRRAPHGAPPSRCVAAAGGAREDRLLLPRRREGSASRRWPATAPVWTDHGLDMACMAPANYPTALNICVPLAGRSTESERCARHSGVAATATKAANVSRSLRGEAI